MKTSEGISGGSWWRLIVEEWSDWVEVLLWDRFGDVQEAVEFLHLFPDTLIWVSVRCSIYYVKKNNAYCAAELVIFSSGGVVRKTPTTSLKSAFHSDYRFVQNHGGIWYDVGYKSDTCFRHKLGLSFCVEIVNLKVWWLNRLVLSHHPFLIRCQPHLDVMEVHSLDTLVLVLC